MAEITPPSSSDSNRFPALFTRMMGPSPPAPLSEPGLSRGSSVQSGVWRKPSRKAVPGLPRAKTFKRQQSENRDKLEATLPTPAERRAVSVDRRTQNQRSSSYTSQAFPRASAPDLLDPEPTTGKIAAFSQISSVPRSLTDEIHSFSLDDIDAASIGGGENYGDNTYPEAVDTADAQSTTTSQYDAMIRDELEREWILNISMHFRDNSKREKFFVTYREKGSMIWRRVTISLDYRNAPIDSLENELLLTKSQREKSAKIYQAIRESLQDIQFYRTVTNLKLETSEGRLHVHVVEDVNEIIAFPTVHMVEHMNCRRIRESQLKFDCHMSGFVYKVRVNGRSLIKKEIPGPDTVDEFLYEINALNSLRFSRSIIEFYGVVVDDDCQVVKGLLISYAEQGALIDVIYDCRERGEQDLPWATREKWARQIVQGLSDIHEAGFVQGDFTLSNIVIDSHGNAKIIDINRRGCPVGWEPPEVIPLINSNLPITMYIGVKSDLYQLGMVLWALATLEDEPEAHQRPLRLRAELDVPPWYRNIVETCLQVNPRLRLQATTLLAQFPELPYEDVYEDQELPKISVCDGTSFQEYVSDERCGRPEVRNNWPYYSASNSRTTSRSSSDELNDPPRGRSPPSPYPGRHGLFPSPPIYGDGMWEKGGSIADGPTADEMTAELEQLADTAKMTAELEQLAATYCAGTVPAYEQTQVPGSNSLVQDNPLKILDVKPIAVAADQDESATPVNEHAHENLDSQETLLPTEREFQDDDNAVTSADIAQIEATQPPNTARHAESTVPRSGEMEVREGPVAKSTSREN